jgi:putative transcriptional regulator
LVIKVRVYLSKKEKYNPSLKLAHEVAKALKSTIEELFIFDKE